MTTKKLWIQRALSRRFALLCVLLGLLGSEAAWAQVPGEADKAAAEALFQQGQQLIAERDYVAACEKFRASQSLDAGLGTLLYLADCYEKAGKHASAWATFEEAASVAQSRGDANRQGVARVRANALKPKLSNLVLLAPSEPTSGLVVRRDGNVVSAATYGVPLPVDPGTVVIEASAPSRVPFRQTIEVAAGEAKTHRVQLPVLEAEPVAGAALASAAPEVAGGPVSRQAQGTPPPVAPRQEDMGGDQRRLGMLVGAAGVVVAAVGGVFFALAAKSKADSEEHCGQNGLEANDCSSTGVELRDEAKVRADFATVGGALGAIALGAGTYLYLSAPVPSGGLESGLALSFRGVW